MIASPILRLYSIVERKEDYRCMQDERRKVISVIASYRDADGYEYRKRFTSYVDPIVPKQGNHKTLNQMEVQF